MTVAEWLKMVKADAERRGGAELVAALEGLGKATDALRAGDWNEIAPKRRGASLEAPGGGSEGGSKDPPLREPS